MLESCLRCETSTRIDDECRWRYTDDPRLRSRFWEGVTRQYRDELTSLKGLNYRQSLRAPRPRLFGIDHTHALPVMHMAGGFLGQINGMRLFGVNRDPPS